MKREFGIVVALFVVYGILRLSYGEDTANMIGVGFILIVLIMIVIFFEQKEKYDIKLTYKNALNYLKEHPDDPEIREKCHSAGERYYKQDNDKLSTIELTTLINSDINKSIGHLEYQNRLSLQK